jgi:hypothetical protein
MLGLPMVSYPTGDCIRDPCCFSSPLCRQTYIIPTELQRSDQSIKSVGYVARLYWGFYYNSVADDHRITNTTQYSNVMLSSIFNIVV